MNRNALVEMIRTSPLLTADERSYWERNLPKLDDKACKKLQSILTVPEGDLPFQKEAEQFVQAIGQAAAMA